MWISGPGEAIDFGNALVACARLGRLADLVGEKKRESRNGAFDGRYRYVWCYRSADCGVRWVRPGIRIRGRARLPLH
jgi:hypothetical protein